MPRLPFPLRRLGLLVGGALVNRDHPRLDHLSSITDPDRYVWAILPHAARSFAPSILFLPEDEAKVAAIGYLYARMLDTYEDLSATPVLARTAMAQFAARFDGPEPGPAPALGEAAAMDARDRVHVLLIERHQLVDRAFMRLEATARKRIVRLIEGMAVGMTEFSEIFETQGGVLETEEQVLAYCRRVIGLPALFTIETTLGVVSDEHARDAFEVSELIQLANITRDIEKDLARGIAYHPALRAHLWTDGRTAGAADVAVARRQLMLLAARRAPSFRRLLRSVGLPRLSPPRAAAVMMMLFTDRHYRRCAAAVGSPTWSGPRRLPTMALTAVPAALSPSWADRVLVRVERDLLAAT